MVIDSIYAGAGFVVLGVCSVLVIRMNRAVSKLKNATQQVRERTAEYVNAAEVRWQNRDTRGSVV